MKLRIQLLLLICTGLVSATLLAEIALRLALPGGIPFAVQWGMPDNAVEERANKASQGVYGSLTFDADGLRLGSGLPYDLSILFLGDSFTEGHGVSDDETFARTTEATLRQHGFRARSLNAGHRGFGAAQELKVLRRILERFHIDAIVVQSFPMNDLSDNLAYGGFGIEDGQLVEYETPRPPLRARVTRAISQSQLQDLYVVRAIANAVSGSSGAAPYDAPISFDLERALLNEIVSTARRHRIPIAMLVIPTKIMQLTHLRSTLQRDDVLRFERVRDLVRQLGVPCIDAGAIITDLEGDAAKGDGSHFSRDGNQLIGAAIAAQLRPLLERTLD